MSSLVYQAINAVSGELAVSGIPKLHHNEEHNYAYRGIEDVLKALAPLLASHKLCVLPRVIDRQSVTSTDGSTQLVVVRVAFDLVSAIDGSAHVVESFGEALDESDKATAKALSAAYKSAMLQAFCIPVPTDDADRASPRLNSLIALPEPPEGWESWSGEVIDIAGSCDTTDAIDRLCSRRRSQLAALQRSRPELYSKVGEAIAKRLADLRGPVVSTASKVAARGSKLKQSNGTAATAPRT